MNIKPRFTKICKQHKMKVYICKTNWLIIKALQKKVWIIKHQKTTTNFNCMMKFPKGLNKAELKVPN